MLGETPSSAPPSASSSPSTNQSMPTTAALPADQERTSLFKLKARSLKLSPLTMPPVSTAASACLGQQQACMSAYPAMQSCDPTAHTSTTTATPHLQYLPPPSAGIVEQSGYASRPFAMDLLDTGCYSAVEPRGPAFNLSSDFGSSVFQFPLPSYPAYPSGMLNSTANSNNHVVYPMHFPSPISSPSNNVHSFADASNSCNAPEPLAAKERPVHLTINTSVGKANIGPVSAPPACSSDRLFADDAAPASNTRPEPASPYAHISPPSASIMLPRGPVAFIPSSSIRQSFKPYLVSSSNLARHYHLQYYRYGSGSGAMSAHPSNGRGATWDAETEPPVHMLSNLHIRERAHQNPYIRRKLDLSGSAQSMGSDTVAVTTSAATVATTSVVSFAVNAPREHDDAAATGTKPIKRRARGGRARNGEFPMSNDPDYYGFTSRSARTTSAERFNGELAAFLSASGKKIERLPSVDRKALSFWALFHAVIELGGYKTVTKHRRWKRVAALLKLPPSLTSSSFTLRTYYEHYLYDFELAFRRDWPAAFDIPAAAPASPCQPQWACAPTPAATYACDDNNHNNTSIGGMPQNASPSMMAHQPAGWSIDTSPQPPAYTPQVYTVQQQQQQQQQQGSPPSMPITPPQAQCSPPGPYMASLINHDAYTANGSPLLISHMQGMQLCAGAMPASASLMTSYQIEQLLASDS